MGQGKGYLAIFKGKKVTFQVVNYNEDLKVRFVDFGEDYKVKPSQYKSFSTVIKIKIVNYGEDVKLRKVDWAGDFEAYFA
ncbi:MAG: hypothetical protein SPG06_03560 [Eubacteriales bacterium]|nr:hypothetical protein [Eubacteriales bacterium]